MKTNLTLLTKSILMVFCCLVFNRSIANNTINTQGVSNLKASIENNSLIVNWVAEPASTTQYYEVQASEDGKTFVTIGFVMGVDPKQNNNTCIFKQNVAKLKPGKVFYRVLDVENDGTATISDVVKLSK
jgi:hypothetical protein